MVPTSNKKLRDPDHFIMNEDNVNEAVAKFLTQRGFADVKYLKGREQGIDVEAVKSNWRLLVESKGSQANHHDPDMVFDGGQLTDHLAKQILSLMRYRQEIQVNKILVAANPDIKRIRFRLKRVENVLNELGIIRFWIQEDRSIKIEAPEILRTLLEEVNLV